MPYHNSEEHKRRKNEWYEKNKSLTVQRSREARERRKEWYNSIMDSKSCVKCGESDNACLDWHHTDPTQKDGSVSRLLSRRSKQTILEEIDKCICLCANCHRKLHYYEK